MLRRRACFSRCVPALDTSPLHVYRPRRDALSPLVATRARSGKYGEPKEKREAREARNKPGLRQPDYPAWKRPLQFGEAWVWPLHNREAWEGPPHNREAWERPPHNREAWGRPPHNREAWKTSPAIKNLKDQEHRALRRPVDKDAMKRETSSGEMWLGKRDPTMSTSDWDRRKKELQFLRDPLDVATFVQQELLKGKTREMLQLVRMASHSMQVVVSWNHIINQLMKTSVSQAMKVYNEMKKRGQFPDSYTYTIILRGLANNASHEDIASKAIAVYHSMSAPNSRVKPSIIHTNAALTVCARTLDMDALWGFVAKIPEHGPAAADGRTFTIVLNAIRQSLLVDGPSGEGENELAQRRERGIMDGRRMWEDVVGKWRNADLIIEEKLVCAMGRLLLIGSRPSNWDDVLSLVEQTMDIPRLVPRLGTIAREVPRLRAPYTPKDLKFNDDHLVPKDEPVRGNEFQAITEGEDRKNSNPITYANPSNETLSMLMEACQKTVATRAAHEYWDMLTDPGTYGIVPDSNNLHHRLRLLRLDRASSATVRMLQEDFKDVKLEPKTFRIAMSTCVRDKNNHNSLRNANQILHLMRKTLPDCDATTTAKYAELAVSFPLANGADLVEVLTHLQPVIKNLRIQLNLGTERTDDGRRRIGARDDTKKARDECAFALQRIYAVFDRLLNSNMIPEEQKASFKAERAIMSSLLNRIKFMETQKSNRNTANMAETNDEAEGDAPAREGETATRESREMKPSSSWRASRAAPAEKRKPWSSSKSSSDQLATYE